MKYEKVHFRNGGDGKTVVLEVHDLAARMLDALVALNQPAAPGELARLDALLDPDGDFSWEMLVECW